MHSWGVPSGNKLSPVFEAYMEVMALDAYAKMNSEGFRKIVKKYDKVMDTQTLSRLVKADQIRLVADIVERDVGGRSGGREGAAVSSRAF